MKSQSQSVDHKELHRLKIQDREALLVQLAESIDQVFWLTSVDNGRVLYVSPAYERIWGRASEELYSCSHDWLDAVHSDDRQRVEEAFESLLRGDSPTFLVEYRIVRPDGQIRWIVDEGTQLRSERGVLSYLSGVARDITEEKKTKAALEEAVAELSNLKKRLEQENAYLHHEIEKSIVGESIPLQVTMEQIRQVAQTDASVLLLGESGTGKSRFARAIHEASRRKKSSLVKVNCASLPNSLIESELFGHLRGAFTGALSDRLGRFHLADEGTIFLDEVGELDPDLQAKLLRVLQDGEFEPVGSHETVKVDVRVIAATNRDLHDAMDEGLFRADLYYRLAVFPIEIPPLRSRKQDIPLLVWHFIAEKQARLGKRIDKVPSNVMNKLVEYDWPGNIRELENVIERAMILSSTNSLMLDQSLGTRSRRKVTSHQPMATLEQIDRDHIIEVLQACKWKIKGRGHAAECLGLAPSTLRYRMKKLGIERPSRRPR